MKKYLSSRYLFIVLVVENLFLIAITALGIFAMVSGHVVPGLGITIMAIVFSWSSLKKYNVVFIEENVLHVKSFFAVNEAYELSDIVSVGNKGGLFYLKLISGKKISFYDSYWSFLPILIFEHKRREKIEKLIPRCT